MEWVHWDFQAIRGSVLRKEKADRGLDESGRSQEGATCVFNRMEVCMCVGGDPTALPSIEKCGFYE